MMKSTSMAVSARAGIFDQLGVVGFSSIEAPLLLSLIHI